VYRPDDLHTWPPRCVAVRQDVLLDFAGFRVPATRLDLVDDDGVARRLRTALDLYEVGERMQRARLRRTRPDATAEEIDVEIRAWLRRRAGAEHGDFPGPPSPRFG
jgi:L-rhamnose isomerase